MKCPRCQHENLPSMKFCGECGARLAAVCSACGAPNAPTQKFCGECGASLTSGGPKFAAPESYTPKHLAEKILTSKSALEGERKQVTVLFCDIVDSTRLAERLDPETMHELMDRILRLMAEAVHRYEGTVNQFLGDGLMALFGAPLAVEEHALRAVQAALAIQETIGGLSEEQRAKRGIEIRLRVGLNTGVVVVGRIGDDLRMDYTAIGETTHLAARLQASAEPGSILAGDATHRLVEGYVRSESLGRVALKGFGEPVAAHRIVGRRRRTRLQVSEERGLSPLVGRERELALLREAFDRAVQGRGQVVGIVGEAGAGKSRLLHEFRRSLEAERVTYLMGACVAYARSIPYSPIVDVLRLNFHIEDGDNALQMDEKVRRGVLSLDPTLESTLPFFRELLSGRAEETLKALDARGKRQKMFEAIRALTVAGSVRAPLVLVVEDLHWIDETSEDYLAFLVDSLPGLRVLLVTTQRPGHAVRWSDRTYYRQIALDVLGEADTATLIRGVLGAEALPEGLVRRVHERAEGNPFFVEEIVRSMVERGTLTPATGGVRWTMEPSVAFPETALEIVRARIDRLEEPVKRTAQVAAVIGREFGERLLAQVVDTAALLQDYLQTLKQAEFVRETRFFPELEYIFKHAIIQDVAYQSILARRRAELHSAIGRAIEHLYADRLAEHYDVLAHHFSHGDDRRKAVEYLVRAGDKAVMAGAAREAMAAYRRALSFVEQDDAKSRADILNKMAPLAFFHLQDGEESLRLAEEALALYERLGDKAGTISAHMHIHTMYIFGGFRYGAESRTVDNLLAVARLMDDDPDSVLKGQVNQRIAHLYLHRGEPALSLDWAARAVTLYERIGSDLGTCLGTALTYTGSVRAGLAYNLRNWEPLLRSGNSQIIAILGHELTHTLVMLRDVPSALRVGAAGLAALQADRQPAGAPWMAMLLRPLLLAYMLAGQTAHAADAAAQLITTEPRTYLG